MVNAWSTHGQCAANCSTQTLTKTSAALPPSLLLLLLCSRMNMTHVVHGFYFGTRPTPRKYYELKKLHPLGLNPEWLDKLHGQEFFSEHTQHTHEHYLQVGLGVWV